MNVEKPNYQKKQNVLKNRIPKPKEEKILIILGNGPSLKNADFELLKKYDTFGLNAAYRGYERMGFTPTYFGSFDYAVCDFHKDTYKKMIMDPNNGIKKYYFVNYHFGKKEAIFQDNNILNHPKFQNLNFQYRHLEKEKNPAFDENLYKPKSFDKFMDMGNSGANAVQVGILLGYNKFILLGCDCNYIELVDGATHLADPVSNKRLVMEKTPVKNPNYWFDDYQQKGDVFNLPQRSTWQQGGWKYLFDIGKRMGVEIVNCSNISEIPYFRFSTLEREALPPLSIIGVHHKCGTVLMAQFAKTAQEHLGKKIHLGEQKDLDEMNVDIWLEKKSKIDLSLLKRRYRMIHIIRHPKELICSGYYYHLKPCCEGWCRKMKYKSENVELETTYQKHLQSLDLPMGLQFEMRESSYRQIRDIYFFIKKNPPFCTHLPLEAVMNDFDNTFKKMMIFFEWRPWMIEKMLVEMQKHNVNHPDNAETTARCKHIHGDKFDPSKWKKIATHELDAYFNNKYGDFISTLGFYYPDILENKEKEDKPKIINSIKHALHHSPFPIQNIPFQVNNLIKRL